MWEVTVLCNVLDKSLKPGLPSLIEFELPRVDMPIGNVLQKHDFSGGQLAGLEFFALNSKPGVQGTLGAAPGGAGNPFVLSMECCQFICPSPPHAGGPGFAA